jgi:hypothetical protein
LLIKLSKKRNHEKWQPNPSLFRGIGVGASAEERQALELCGFENNDKGVL